ncbi:chemokine-like protein TAFA-5 isoform X2 [Corvus hawaiiensis]|uniref:chemokine-like protein TAFA-5 isoform X2 n=1 Tax=Corvus hawaiiensis TaxID=134902 RepID=UPI002018E754|nr:chemokine-like protein TAFA-5 isoform X2 [Corvus hawaiiensis]
MWRKAISQGESWLVKLSDFPPTGEVASMAPSPRRSSRKDANALPSMSSTFWAIMILASLLIAYCSQLAAGTCEIVTLDRDSSQPRRTIARQTARCACKKGQIAGTTRARPACVDARIIKTKQWCEMLPCLEGEGCDLLINKSGWTCTQPGGRIKTTTKWLDINLEYAASGAVLPSSSHSFKSHRTIRFRIVLLAVSIVSESFLTTWTALSFLPTTKWQGIASILCVRTTLQNHK